MSTVYVSIGNSDDKLTQAEWSMYYQRVDRVVRHAAATVYGAWVSPSAEPFQNACWAIELTAATASADVVTRDGQVTHPQAWLRDRLAELATRYHQDSIAWADATTTFITPVAEPSG